MIRGFEETDGHLSFRLLAALEHGHAAGGDRRGMQSATMLIVKKDGGVWLNNDVVLRLQDRRSCRADPGAPQTGGDGGGPERAAAVGDTYVLTRNLRRLVSGESHPEPEP